MPSAAPRILIVNDDTQQLAQLKRALDGRGWNLFTAPSGVKALQTLDSQQIDLLLTALTMPDADGIELLRRAQHNDAGVVGIVTCGHGSNQAVVDGLKAGAYDYVFTPCDVNVTLSTVTRALETQRLRAEVRTLTGQCTQLERANQALRTINTELDCYAQSISHDLRGPLHAVLGFAQILLEAPSASTLSADQKEHIRLMQDAAQQMAHMTEELLRFARSPRKRLQKDTVDVNALIDEIVTGLRAVEPLRRVEVRHRPLPAVSGNGSLLRHVFANLLSNAFKYTRHTQLPVIEIRGSRQPGGCTYVVRDNGAGFDMSSAEKLFGQFERLHQADEFEGTGIGLSLARRIVEGHGGTISAVGKPGEGAEFTVTLPL